MKRIQAIDDELAISRSHADVVRRIYCTEFPRAFVGHEGALFDILSRVSGFFRIPIHQICIAGSAQTGICFHDDRDFLPGESDLDLAIVNAKIFDDYLRAVREKALADGALGRPDKSVFPTAKGVTLFNDFIEKVSFNGMILPHMMPVCNKKTDHMSFFRRLSEKYIDLFKNINAAIYLSHEFFELKQEPNIKMYVDGVRR